MTFSFTEPVTSVSLSDLKLTRNGVNVSLQGATLSHSTDQTHWTISNLSGLTGTDGVYNLKLDGSGPAIQDYNGASMPSAVSTSWTTDTVAPTIAMTTPANGGDTLNHKPKLSAAAAADNTGGSGLANVQFQIVLRQTEEPPGKTPDPRMTAAPFSFTFQLRCPMVVIWLGLSPPTMPATALPPRPSLSRKSRSIISP